MHEEDFKTILLLIQLEIWNPESSGLPFFSRCHMGHGLGYPGYPKNFETNQDGSQWTWTAIGWVLATTFSATDLGLDWIQITPQCIWNRC